MENKKIIRQLVVLFILILSTNYLPAYAVKPKVIVYPAPAGEKLSGLYQVNVSGRAVPVYMAKVAPKDKARRYKATDDTRNSALYFDEAAFAYFDMRRKIEVTVSVPENIDSVKILPLSASVKPVFKQGRITFWLTKPQNLTIEVNGEYVKSLHLFANPIDANIPSANDKNVIFFGPGIHQVSHLTVGDNKTVYVAGGAIVQAVIDPGEPFTIKGKDSLKNYGTPSFDLRGNNITIRGGGIIDASACPTHARSLLMVRGTNIRVEGLILRDVALWTVPVRQSDNVVIDNIKLLGYRANSDGIDICNSRNVVVQNCFIRTSDDLVVIKSDKGQGAVKNITVKNCVLWNQIAHALSIGAELREPVDSVLFTDCDIIHDQGREWSLRVYHCDAAVISHVRFENIRIEEAHRLISLWIGKAIWSRDNDYGHIHDVVFKNITATGAPLTIELKGMDKGHAIQNVGFDNIKLNGKAMTITDAKANEFATGISVLP